MWYVYRFINNDSEVIYIGRTGDLEKRLGDHRRTKDKKYAEMKHVEYIEVPKKGDCLVLEPYFINKYMSVYNHSLKADGVTVKIEPYKWQIYNPSIYNSSKKLREEIVRLKQRISELEENKEKQSWYKERRDYWSKNDSLHKTIDELKTELLISEQHVDILVEYGKSANNMIQSLYEEVWKSLGKDDNPPKEFWSKVRNVILNLKRPIENITDRNTIRDLSIKCYQEEKLKKK